MYILRKEHPSSDNQIDIFGNVLLGTTLYELQLRPCTPPGDGRLDFVEFGAGDVRLFL